MPAGTITALRAQARDTQRVNVFIDEEFAIGVSLDTLAREGLHVGYVLDDTGWGRLEAAEYTNKALQAAVRLIETRPRSSAEVRQRLLRKEHPAPAVDAALERLIEVGLLDDAAFCRYWIENRQLHNPRGQMALRDELRRKGVHRDVIAAALQEHHELDDEHERALTLARSVLHKYVGATDKRSFQRRLGGFLQRRGFKLDAVLPILDTLWNETQEEAS